MWINVSEIQMQVRVQVVKIVFLILQDMRTGVVVCVVADFWFYF